MTTLHEYWSHFLLGRLEQDLALAADFDPDFLDIAAFSSAYITHGIHLLMMSGLYPTKDMSAYLRTLVDYVDGNIQVLPILASEQKEEPYG